MKLATLKLIAAAERLADLADDLENVINALNLESAQGIIKPETDIVYKANNIGVNTMIAISEINVSFAVGKLRDAAADVRGAVDARLGRPSSL